MSHRHRTVLPKQQQCHGLADDITSAYHHTLFSGDLNTGTLQQLYDSCRSTGHKARLADAECTDILGMKSVYILLGINQSQNARLVKPFRQRQLHQNAVDIGSVI